MEGALNKAGLYSLSEFDSKSARLKNLFGNASFNSCFPFCLSLTFHDSGMRDRIQAKRGFPIPLHFGLKVVSCASRWRVGFDGSRIFDVTG